MATVCELKSILSASLTRDGEDSVTERWQATYDAVQTNVATAVVLAQQAGLPSRYDQYHSTSLYVSERRPQVQEGNRRVWYWDVTYSTLDRGDGHAQLQENPLLRPPVWDLDLVDSDERITLARNVYTLARAAGGQQRTAGTLGPIVNAAGEQPDEALVRPTQNPILVGRVNKASLGAIAALITAYRNTANSGYILGFAARTLQFLGARSLGRTEENGFAYFPCEIRIEVVDTTDLVIDNVGWHHWQLVDEEGVQNWKLSRAQVEVVDSGGRATKADAAAPVNLNNDGTLGSDAAPTSIVYRHRTDVSYASLIIAGV